MTHPLLQMNQSSHIFLLLPQTLFFSIQTTSSMTLFFLKLTHHYFFLFLRLFISFSLLFLELFLSFFFTPLFFNFHTSFLTITNSNPILCFKSIQTTQNNLCHIPGWVKLNWLRIILWS